MTPDQSTTERIIDCAKRLVEYADFKLSGALSSSSTRDQIPSRASSSVKARHLVALKNALAAHDAAQKAEKETGQSTQAETLPPCSGGGATLFDKSPEFYVQWLRNNYQDFPNIATLCDEMRKAAYTSKDSEQ